MTTVAILQPTYLPWLGYFELMDRADAVILLDDVQFEKCSWQSRNRIKTQAGEQVLSVPILTAGKPFGTIAEAEIDVRQSWARKHARAIEQAYARAEYGRSFPEFFAIYQCEWHFLRPLNRCLINYLAERFGITTPMRYASEFVSRTGRNEHIIDLCRAVGADVFYEPAGGRGLFDEGAFAEAGIEILYQEYEHPVYRQLHGEFLPCMSAVDLLLNEGPRSLEVIRSGARGLCSAALKME